MVWPFCTPGWVKPWPSGRAWPWLLGLVGTALLLHFLIPGGIYVQEVRGIRTDSLRDQIGIVLQKNFLFSGTVRENIRLGKIGASDREVEEAVLTWLFAQ